MDTVTATVNSAAQALARQIATAVFTKLALAKEYTLSIRRHGEIAAMPWVEICFCRIGKPPETHEHVISMPEASYLVATKEDRTALATYIYKTAAMMTGKLKPKESEK